MLNFSEANRTGWTALATHPICFRVKKSRILCLFSKVFRIDYNSIMQKLQANAITTAPSASATAPSAVSATKASASTSSLTSTSSSTACYSTSPSSLASSSTASASRAHPPTAAARPSSSVALACSSADDQSSSTSLPSASAACSPSSACLPSSSKAPSSTAVTSKGSSLAASGATGTRPSILTAMGKSGVPFVANGSSTRKGGRMQCHNEQATSTGVVSCAPQIIPIAPNVVTMRAFKKLLMHREKLEEISRRSPCNQSSDTRGSMPTGGALLDSSQQDASFANTHDYNVLSSRFHALFMWPLLLSTHEARSINDNILTKELVSAQREKPRADIPTRTVAQQLRPESNLSVRHELVCNRIVRGDPQVCTNERPMQPKEKHSEFSIRKKKKKPVESRKIGKKRSLQSLSDSDSSEDITEADLSTSSKILTSDFADSVSINKDSLRKAKKSKSS